MTTKHAGMSTAELQALDSRHHLHPFTDFKALAAKGSRIITHADGIYLWDSEGRRILDGMAGLWCVNVGFGRKELAQAAYEQMLSLPYYNNFFQTTHPPAIELASLLNDVSPAHINHVFFTGSGSDANDTVIRMVRRFWDVQGKPRKKTIISRKNAYHGSTVAAASLGGMAAMHAQGDLPIPGIVHIDQPYWFVEGGELDADEFGRRVAGQLAETIEQLGVERVAAFVAEPVQGAGGVIIPPDSYWPEIKKICDRYDILLVVDEVICGFGRLGKWFGADYYGLKADLMPIAKGLSSGYLPIGGVMVSDRVADGLIQEGGEFFHGFTYSGHPAACAVAAENIRIMQRENIVENVATDTAPYLAQRWQEFTDHPLVGEARSIGLLAALELVQDKASRTLFDPVGKVGTLCRDICFEKGIVMRAVRDTMIISPPLIITRDQIDEICELVRACLDATASKLGIS